MILAGEALADAVFHKSRQGRKHAHRRVDGLAMKLAVQYDLALRDVSGQVRDRMGNVVVGHGQDRDLGHGALHALHDAGALIEGRQLAV